FDQRAAERVNDAADAAGFDAVEIGAVIALRMETSGGWGPGELRSTGRGGSAPRLSRGGGGPGGLPPAGRGGFAPPLCRGWGGGVGGGGGGGGGGGAGGGGGGAPRPGGWGGGGGAGGAPGGGGGGPPPPGLSDGEARWEVDGFDPVADSEHNAQLALAILEDV